MTEYDQLSCKLHRVLSKSIHCTLLSSLSVRPVYIKTQTAKFARGLTSEGILEA